LVDELRYLPSTAQLRLNNLAKTQGFINQENRLLKSQSAEPLSLEEQRELFAVAETAPAHKIKAVLQHKKYELEVRKTEAQGLPTPAAKAVTQKIILDADVEMREMLHELKFLVFS
jgi:hypothetical protein